MFRQLVPLLRQRSVLLTVTRLWGRSDPRQCHPQEAEGRGESALATPMSFTGPAVELDEQLPDAIACFVASHLELKNTLARAGEEMDAAAKVVQEEARNKAKSNKKPASVPETTAEPAAKEEPKKEPGPPRLPGLFDTAAADAKPSPATSV